MMEACLEKGKAGLDEIEFMMDVFKERFDKMDTTDLEANPEEKETIAEQQEVPNEEAAVEMIGAQQVWSGDQHLAVRCRGWLIRHAVPARCKGCRRKGPTIEKRYWKGLECNNGIRN
jgi:hypothetical protein